MEENGHNWKNQTPKDKCINCGRTLEHYQAFKRAKGSDENSLRCKPKE